MAEDSFGEKTEDATPRKIQKAREEGQVGKSIEIPAVFVILAGVFIINLLGLYIYQHLSSIMSFSFTFDNIPDVDILYCLTLFYTLQKEFVIILSPIF